MSDLLQSGRHPDADQLNAFVEQTLPAHERQETLAHLAICPDCRSIVALSLPPLDESPSPEPNRRPWFSGWTLAWAAAPALGALVIFLVYFRHSAPIETASSRPPASPLAPPPALPAVVSAPPLLAAKPTARRASEPRKAIPSPAAAVPGNGAPALDTGQASVVATGAAIRMAKSVAPESPLPSGLPVLSVASSGHQRLAIDTANTLFFSEDDGGNWKVVPSPWTGRAVAVALVSPVPAKARGALTRAEAGRSAVSGTVTDSSGAAIVDVTVAASNTRTSDVRTAKTNQDGHYLIQNLAPGHYQVEAEVPGFLKQSLDVEVAPTQTSVANLKLSIGASSTAVEVQAMAGPILQAPSASAAPGSLPVFEISTDTGDKWTSTDGQTWKLEPVHK